MRLFLLLLLLLQVLVKADTVITLDLTLERLLPALFHDLLDPFLENILLHPRSLTTRAVNNLFNVSLAYFFTSIR